MDQFRNALESCNLKDLGFKGARHTWTNGRHDGGFIKEQLDRAVANLEWCAIYREVIVFVLAARTLDHKPLLMHFNHDKEDKMEFHRSFNFEAKWQLDEDYGAIMEEAWHEGNVEISGIQMVQKK